LGNDKVVRQIQI